MSEPIVIQGAHGVWPLELRADEKRPGCYQVRIHGEAEYFGWQIIYGEWSNALAANLFALRTRLEAVERERDAGLEA